MLTPSNSMLKSPLKKGDWLAARVRIAAENRVCGVPVPIFQQALIWAIGRSAVAALCGVLAVSGLTSTVHAQCETGWEEAYPTGRWGMSATYDDSRDVLVMFGGQVDNATLDETWEFDGITWRRRMPSTSPGRLAQCGLAFDVVRGVSVLFGGRLLYQGNSGQTWEWDGEAWTLRADDGPEARYGHAMAYDATRNLTMIFGGYTSEWKGDTWAWDGTSWNRMATTGPAQRGRSAMAYDPRRKVIVLFGGEAVKNGSSVYFNDTWEWDGSEWSRKSTEGPPARFLHAMTYDPYRRSIVLHGGQGGPENDYAILDDTWEWDGETWAQITGSGPSPRAGHIAIWHARHVRTIVFGGKDDGGDVHQLADMWTRVFRRWLQVADAPPRRHGMSLAYDQAGDQTLLFGGYETRYRNDTLTWNGARWLKLDVEGPPPRAHAVMAYDVAREKTVLFGGWNGRDRLGDTWEFDGAVWSERATDGPAPRDFSAGAYDAARGVVVLVGGATNDGFANDTWEWDGANWTKRKESTLVTRDSHAVAYDPVREVIVLFGGYDVYRHSRTTAEWNGEQWTNRTASGPTARFRHALVYTAARGGAFLFGGQDKNADRDDDEWVWDGSRWTRHDLAGPRPRFLHALACDAPRETVVLFGGNSSGSLADTWELGPRIARGDANGDHAVDFDDIAPFAAGLIGDRQEYLRLGGVAHGWERRDCWGDMNDDGAFDVNDLDGFIARLGRE